MGYDENEDRPLKFHLRAALNGGPLSGGMILGMLLIIGGALLFIDNLGILPITLEDAFWPLVLLAVCGTALRRTRSVAIKVWCWTGMVAGVLMLMQSFHLIRQSAEIVWPLMLIGTGVVMLIYRLRWSEFTNRFQAASRFNIGTNSKGASTTSHLQEVALFSGIKRRVETQNFEGAELNSVFGGIEVDLRWAGISLPGRVVEIEANTAFGSVEIRIPETWRLNMQGHAVFGAYEDKTIPPRPEPGVEPPMVIIRGGTVFGAVTVRN